MTIKLATCLLALSFLSACQSTQSTANSPSMQQQAVAQNTRYANSLQESAPPAEGPEDIPAEGPIDPSRNPALLPTPLLRTSAASGL
jgi:hypothetical protein